MIKPSSTQSPQGPSTRMIIFSISSSIRLPLCKLRQGKKLSSRIVLNICVKQSMEGFLSLLMHAGIISHHLHAFSSLNILTRQTAKQIHTNTMHIWACIYMHTYINTYTHTQTQTHTPTHKLFYHDIKHLNVSSPIVSNIDSIYKLFSFEIQFL